MESTENIASRSMESTAAETTGDSECCVLADFASLVIYQHSL
jgi:hypothetical protein